MARATATPPWQLLPVNDLAVVMMTMMTMKREEEDEEMERILFRLALLPWPWAMV
jgi:hypothetical protein